MWNLKAFVKHVKIGIPDSLKYNYFLKVELCCLCLVRTTTGWMGEYPTYSHSQDPNSVPGTILYIQSSISKSSISNPLYPNLPYPILYSSLKIIIPLFKHLLYQRQKCNFRNKYFLNFGFMVSEDSPNSKSLWFSEVIFSELWIKLLFCFEINFSTDIEFELKYNHAWQRFHTSCPPCLIYINLLSGYPQLQEGGVDQAGDGGGTEVESQQGRPFLFESNFIHISLYLP